MASPALVVDLGGGSIKYGLSSEKDPSCADNCIYRSKNVSGRNFIGNEVEDYYSDLNLFFTEPYFNFSSTKETLNELFFEEYHVAGLVRANPAFFATYKYRTETNQHISRYTFVIDSGYSFTHILPMADGKLMKEFALRLCVGGKILTNRLIEVTSYRQLDVRSEIYIMNQCKEDACFVSKDFWKDLAFAKSRESSHNTIAREYVLPDYIDVHRGYLRPPSEKPKDAAERAKLQGYILRLNNERFTVPELLFHPSDVGYSEMGISEASEYLLTERLPPAVRPGAMANIVLIGGNSKFPGYRERVLSDLRSCAPSDLSVNVFSPPE
nr:Actin protein 6 [Hymenolepis microstoma]